MSIYKPCPKCNSSNAEKMSFTWWGGLIGPRLLTHVKCTACGTQYNGKTGRDNTAGIIVYTLGVLVIVGIFIIVAIAVVVMLATAS